MIITKSIQSEFRPAIWEDVVFYLSLGTYVKEVLFLPGESQDNCSFLLTVRVIDFDEPIFCREFSKENFEVGRVKVFEGRILTEVPFGAVFIEKKASKSGHLTKMPAGVFQFELEPVNG